MDWASRKTLSWRLPNTLDPSFCVEALEEAIAKFGVPEIFNSDQGSQFTSDDFIGVLERHGIQISMDGKGGWMDNVFVERAHSDDSGHLIRREGGHCSDGSRPPVRATRRQASVISHSGRIPSIGFSSAWSLP